ncbi:hypothetical protein IWZ01DRAFT_503470 [Phyllosticta capitalensis]
MRQQLPLFFGVGLAILSISSFCPMQAMRRADPRSPHAPVSVGQWHGSCVSSLGQPSRAPARNFGCHTTIK